MSWKQQAGRVGNDKGTSPSARIGARCPRKVKQVLKVHWYPRYVPVDAQRARTVSEMNRLAASGVKVQPVELRGRTLASSFWGRRWCEHVESFSEYAARLAHGRACLRNGSVCHLSMEPGGVDAMVIGSGCGSFASAVQRGPGGAASDMARAT